MSVKPASVTTADGDDENVRGSKKQQNSSKMYIIGREICFILAILFTTYAAVLNTNQTNAKGPPPTPFFRKDSLVEDYFSGELRTMLKKVSEVELMFIMYYAPWDAESQSLRKEFEIAAEHHHKQVFFAAINCWQPGSECRTQASKIPILTYPEFIAYPLHGSPIGYEGQRLAGHMIKFVNRLLHPLQRIETPEELQTLRIRNDAVVVGCIEFNNMRGDVEYKALYETALKLVERDTKDIGFAVITNPIAAARIGIKWIPSVTLYLWNEVKEYTESWKTDTLSQWISQNLNSVTTWLSPPGIKSLTFKPFVDDGSVLIMFTPKNPLFSHSDAYDMLRETALLYYNCKNNTYLESYIKDFSYSRLNLNRNEEAIHSACRRHRKSFINSVKGSDFEIPIQIVENVWINTSSSGLKSRKRTHSVCSWSESSASWSTDTDSTCVVPSVSAESSKDFSDLHDKTTISMLKNDRDYKSAPSLISWKLIERCKQYFRALSFGTTAQATDSSHRNQSIGFVGLGCKDNHTLSFLAMDSNVYQHFADGLGIDLSEYVDRTAVLILNAEQESVYIMQKPLKIRNIQDFIQNYTDGRLERHLRSEPRTSLPPNRYSDNTKTSNRKSTVSLLELTSHTFLTVALNESQNAVVFYHSPFCAFCHSISHIYLTVAHQLRNITDLIFTRIDGENNDLPWEFTVHHYPSILFLPAFKKSESRLFPQKLPITIDNLSKFVMANLNMEARLQGMIELCSRWNSKQHRKIQEDCVVGIRQACLNMIAETLKEYRVVSRTSTFTKYRKKLYHYHLLKRLRYLKEIHIQLGASKISTAVNLINEFHSKATVNNETSGEHNNGMNKVIKAIKEEL